MGFVDYLLLNRQVLLTKAELSEKRLKTRLWVLYSLFPGLLKTFEALIMTNLQAICPPIHL